MAVINWATCLALLATGSVSSISPNANEINVNGNGQVGNWSVGNCILAKFAMNFTVSYNISNIVLPNLILTLDEVFL